MFAFVALLPATQSQTTTTVSKTKKPKVVAKKPDDKQGRCNLAIGNCLKKCNALHRGRRAELSKEENGAIQDKCHQNCLNDWTSCSKDAGTIK
jgi:hypothetical protein